jgi:hypothetical protein
MTTADTARAARDSILETAAATARGDLVSETCHGVEDRGGLPSQADHDKMRPGIWEPNQAGRPFPSCGTGRTPRPTEEALRLRQLPYTFCHVSSIKAPGFTRLENLSFVEYGSRSARGRIYRSP